MPQRLHNKKTPLTKRQECGILYVSAANRCWPTIVLPEMTGFYNQFIVPVISSTIALPEMTGFYNGIVECQPVSNTIALPFPAGL